MTTKARLFAKFERVFKDLTTDDIIKLITEHFTTNDLSEFLEHCQEEHAVESIYYGIDSNSNDEADDE